MNNPETKVNPRLAIVATVADAADHIEFFIQYHLGIGVEHLFVFIDDCCEETLAVASHYPNVTAVPVNEHIEELWKTVPPYRNLEKRALKNREVMVRQEYNAYLGSYFAKEIDIDWLLHIDIDELLYLNGNNLSQHLLAMQRKGLGGCIYTNYEAIPVQLHSDCIYRSTTFFKKNFFKRGTWFFSEEQREFIKNSSWLSDFFFNYYQNGKAAANIHNELVVEDVHAMWGGGNRSLEFLSVDDPIILHFPVATIKEFKKKYKRLGNFADFWKGFLRAGKFIDTFHLEARDAFHQEDDSIFEDLYRSKVLLTKPKINELIGRNLAVEIEDIVRHGESINRSDISPRACSYTRKQSLVIPPKHNNLPFNQRSINSLARSCEVPEISFESIGKARVWLRRHPVLAKEESCSIKQTEPFKLNIGGHDVADIGSPNAPTSLARGIGDEVRSEGSVVLDTSEPAFCKNYTRETVFDFSIKKIKILAEAAKQLEREDAKKTFFILPEEYQYYLINATHVGFVDSALSEVVLKALSSNNVVELATYLTGRYPRHKRTNWAIEMPSNILNHPRAESAVAVIYALGGTALLHKGFLDKDFVKHFLNIRARYPFITNEYSKAIIGEHEQIVFLLKSSSRHEFLAVCNLTDRNAVVSTEQFRKNRIPLVWNDLISSKIFEFTENETTVYANQYLWLIRNK